MEDKVRETKVGVGGDSRREDRCKRKDKRTRKEKGVGWLEIRGLGLCFEWGMVTGTLDKHGCHYILWIFKSLYGEETVTEINLLVSLSLNLTKNSPNRTQKSSTVLKILVHDTEFYETQRTPRTFGTMYHL